jgi:MFS superfamily sulfate permease-like transporter
MMKKFFTPHISNDLLASVVVFLVALPLCMGIAIASGVPPAAGLLTGIIGGLVVGVFSGSPLQVSGPAAGLTIIVWEIVQGHGIQSLGPILLVAGLLQIIAGALRLGQWFRAMSPAVVYGMLAGIGVLIFAGQFHVMIDDKPRASGMLNLLALPAGLVKGLTPDHGLSNNEAAAIGVLTILVLVVWSKFAPAKLKLIPGALIAVTIATIVAQALKLRVAYVKMPDSLVASISLPSASVWHTLLQPDILATAAAVAFVASAESLLSAAAVDRMHDGPRAKFDKELAAQGIGNMLCGLVGALPMTGVIVRSSANVQSGGKTRLSAIFHGVWLLAAVLAFPSVLRMVPVCALAGILVYTGIKLVDLRSLKHLQRYGRFPLLIYAATLIGIVATDLLKGVMIGLALSLAKVLYQVAHLSVRVEAHSDDRLDLHLEGAATFLRLPKLASTLDHLPASREVHVHFQRLLYIDHSCLDVLTNWHDQQVRQGRMVVLEWEELHQRFERPLLLQTPQPAVS